MPTLKPMMVAQVEWLRTSGMISSATAAKTTPAAACWIALVVFGAGGRQAAMAPPAIVAATGASVKSVAWSVGDVISLASCVQRATTVGLIAT